MVLLMAMRITVLPLRTNAQSRIVGGTNATMAEFPHQVLIYVAGYMCGGSLISSQYVLTAAHCVVDHAGVPYNARAFNVYAGLQNRRSLAKNALNPYFQRRTVSIVIVHPRYDDETYDYDLAVLKLSAPVQSSTGVKVIRLATTAHIYKPLYVAGIMATVSGWGDTSFQGTSSYTLRKVQVPIVSNAACNVFYGPGIITNQMTCAGYAAGGNHRSISWINIETATRPTWVYIYQMCAFGKAIAKLRTVCTVRNVLAAFFNIEDSFCHVDIVA